MENIANFFDGNYIFNIISFLIGITGLILAFIFYFKSLREKKPFFNINTFNLIDSKLSTINKLEIKYNESIVENLSVSKVAIWNSGSNPIVKDDFASNDYLSIVAPENLIIYDFEISFQQEANGVNVIPLNENSIKIDFEFLNQNDGFVITIYHNGNSSQDITVKGTFIGAKKISRPIEKEYLLEKINDFTNIITTPYSNLYKLFRIILFPLILLVFIFIAPFALLASLLDAIRYRLLPKTPDIFNLNSN